MSLAVQNSWPGIEVIIYKLYFSVFITQKSVNNDEPLPSPNIKANDLPKESSITSSEVSYGMDHIFSRSRVTKNVVLRYGVRRA